MNRSVVDFTLPSGKNPGQTAPVVQSTMLETTTRKGSDTRERLLAAAEQAVLAKGFAATSIDELIAAKGA